MVERAEHEPTMEEIVVALRETKRSADRVQPFPITGPPRGPRTLRPVIGSNDHTDLRDTEIERLLSENARLNARIVALLKVIEQEQQLRHADGVAEIAPTEADRDAIYREVRAALESELSPVLVVLLRLLERYHAETGDGDPSKRRLGITSGLEGSPSDWIVDLMRKLESNAAGSVDPIEDADAARRRPKLRDRMAEVLNALRLEPYSAPPRRRPTSPEERV